MRAVWLVLGPIVALVVYGLVPDGYVDAAGATKAIGHAGRASAALAAWMALWWLGEATHVSVTALLPLALFPILGALPMKDVAGAYGNPLIFLFMGGFMLALAMERWGLHGRVALLVLRGVGTRPVNLVLGLMLASAGLSMWVSNTSTAVLMLPIALSVVELVVPGTRAALERGEALDADGHNFARASMLGVAYGASIGGLGTIIGTAPNVFVVSFLKQQLGLEIGFGQWMLFAVPLVALFLPATWILLTRLVFPIRLPAVEGAALGAEAYRALGPVSRGEKTVLVAFLLAAAAWVSQPLLAKLEVGGATPLAGLTDSGIAILVAIGLFVAPVSRKETALDWNTAKQLPWDILILFGGGLALADALAKNGVGELLGAKMTIFAGAPPLLILVAVVTLVVFLTELTSNTATTAALVPIFAGAASGMGASPATLAIATALSASCAFMLPVATPPNAIVFGSGFISVREMCRAGFWLNLVSIALITTLLALFGRFALGLP